MANQQMSTVLNNGGPKDHEGKEPAFRGTLLFLWSLGPLNKAVSKAWHRLEQGNKVR